MPSRRRRGRAAGLRGQRAGAPLHALGVVTPALGFVTPALGFVTPASASSPQPSASSRAPEPPPDRTPSPPPPPPAQAEDPSAATSAPPSPPDACLDVIIEPSLEGGRLLAVEHSASPARTAVHKVLKANGWQRRWLRPSHYSSPHASSWLRRQLWHPSRLEVMTAIDDSAEAEGSSAGGAGGSPSSPGSARQARARGRANARGGGSSSVSKSANVSLGLRAWRKPSFMPEDLVIIEEACLASSLRLDQVHLLTSDRQQTVPLPLLRLWPSRLRLRAEQHSHP